MTDTTPNRPDPSTLEGYEPPVEGETDRERRARKARNRRLAERVQREAAAADESTSTPPRGRPSAASKRAQSVTGILTMTGLMVMALDENDGAAIVEGAPKLGESLAKVAEKNPRVAKALDALTETSAWGEVGLAVAAIALPIAKNHGMTLGAVLRKPEPDVEPEQTRPTSTSPAPDVAPEQTSTDAPVFVIPTGPTSTPVPTFGVNVGG